MVVQYGGNGRRPQRRRNIPVGHHSRKNGPAELAAVPMSLNRSAHKRSCLAFTAATHSGGSRRKKTASDSTKEVGQPKFRKDHSSAPSVWLRRKLIADEMGDMFKVNRKV